MAPQTRALPSHVPPARSAVARALTSSCATLRATTTIRSPVRVAARIPRAAIVRRPRMRRPRPNARRTRSPVLPAAACRRVTARATSRRRSRASSAAAIPAAVTASKSFLRTTSSSSWTARRIRATSRSPAARSISTPARSRRQVAPPRASGRSVCQPRREVRRSPCSSGRTSRSPTSRSPPRTTAPTRVQLASVQPPRSSRPAR